jgi:hypothetical protein
MFSLFFAVSRRRLEFREDVMRRLASSSSSLMHSAKQVFNAVLNFAVLKVLVFVVTANGRASAQTVKSLLNLDVEEKKVLTRKFLIHFCIVLLFLPHSHTLKRLTVREVMEKRGNDFHISKHINR